MMGLICRVVGLEWQLAMEETLRIELLMVITEADDGVKSTSSNLMEVVRTDAVGDPVGSGLLASVVSEFRIRSLDWRARI